jgi:hypothetical protein
MTEIGTIGDIKVPIAIEFESASRELKLALLQAQLSEKAKTSAMDTMNEIEDIQKDKTLVSKYYQEALTQQKAATATAKTGMSADMLAYMEEKELAFTTSGAATPSKEAIAALMAKRKAILVENGASPNNLWGSEEECKASLTNDLKVAHKAAGYPQDSAGWDTAIASLKAHQETQGTEVQKKMVFAQDFMGQYNSYLQGANSSIQQFFQNLGEAARIR